MQHDKCYLITDEARTKLVVIIKNPGIFNFERVLQLRSAVLGGQGADDIDFEITEDGSLASKIEVKSNVQICEDPQDWRPTFLKGKTQFGILTANTGACAIHGFTWGRTTGTKSTAELKVWNWSAFDESAGNWWATRLTFPRNKEPKGWFMPRANSQLSLCETQYNVWSFAYMKDRYVYFFKVENEWFMLFQSDPGDAPQEEDTNNILTAVSFALGEPIYTDIFAQIGESGVCGLAGYFRPRDIASGVGQIPAVPTYEDTSFFVRFVESMLTFMFSERTRILHVAINHYLEGLSGSIDSEFMHNWIGTEAVAKWMLNNGRAEYPPSLIDVKDKESWKSWVKSERKQIVALANEGAEDRLFQRIMGAFSKRTNPVEDVFRNLGIEWSDEMDRAYNIRNFVVHEGTLHTDNNMDWQEELKRVAIMKTLLTAIIAKLVGYDGPIRDRWVYDKDAVPSWWRQ